MGTRLREARLAAGMSQAILSECTGVPKPTLSRYENDHVAPSVRTLQRLAVALGVTESTLFGGEHSPEQVFVEALRAEGVTFVSESEARRLATEIANSLRRTSRRRRADTA